MLRDQGDAASSLAAIPEGASTRRTSLAETTLWDRVQRGARRKAILEAVTDEDRAFLKRPSSLGRLQRNGLIEFSREAERAWRVRWGPRALKIAAKAGVPVATE